MDNKITDKKVIDYREANKRCDYCKYYSEEYSYTFAVCKAKRKSLLLKQQARTCKLFTLDDKL